MKIKYHIEKHYKSIDSNPCKGCSEVTRFRFHQQIKYTDGKTSRINVAMCDSCYSSALKRKAILET